MEQNVNDDPKFLNIASSSAASSRMASNLNDSALFRSLSDELYDKYATQGMENDNQESELLH